MPAPTTILTLVSIMNRSLYSILLSYVGIAALNKSEYEQSPRSKMRRYQKWGQNEIIPNYYEDELISSLWHSPWCVHCNPDEWNQVFTKVSHQTFPLHNVYLYNFSVHLCLQPGGQFYESHLIGKRAITYIQVVHQAFRVVSRKSTGSRHVEVWRKIVDMG